MQKSRMKSKLKQIIPESPTRTRKAELLISLANCPQTKNAIQNNSLNTWLIVFCASCASCALHVSVRNICAKLYLFPQCAIYVQDLRKIVLIPQCAIYAKICARVYLFLQCAIYAQDLRKIVLLSPMRNYAQDLHKIVLISPMHNICTRFVQDCTSFSNAQYMHKICARLYFSP